MRRGGHGFSLIELGIVCCLMGILASVALPLSETATRRRSELELKATLREVRTAIDRFYDDQLHDNRSRPEQAKYPPDLDTLVARKYLRSYPVDPITGEADWQIISTAGMGGRRSGSGMELWDIRSNSDKIAIDGTEYASW